MVALILMDLCVMFKNNYENYILLNAAILNKIKKKAGYFNVLKNRN
jgi:hypothetical protein